MDLRLYADYVHRRLHKMNKNWLAVVCGETGSGKSWRALRLAQMIDSNFNKSKICWTTKALMEYADERATKGDIVVWDESGIDEGASKRSWYSEQNKTLNYLFQTNRHENYGVIMTLPSLSFLDSGLINLIHTYFECIYLDEDKDAVRCIVRNVQHNPLQQKTYYKNYRFKYQDRTWILNNIWINRPHDTKGVVTYFEEQQTIFKRAKVKDWRNKLLELDEKKLIDPKKPNDISQAVQTVVDNIDKYTKVFNKKTIVDRFKLQNEFQVGKGTASRIAAAVNSKIVLN